MNSLDYKKQIVQACRENLLESIQILEEEMKMLQESAASGTEDGMSDHLESNDEGMMNERKDREARRTLLYEDLRILDEIDLSSGHDRVGPGTAIVTDTRHLLVAIARTFQVGDTPFVGLSTAAPVYTAMEGKKAGESYTFNGQTVELKDIF